MLLHQSASKVEITEGFTSASFTIVDSQNSFALLQGKQYSDPVAATLRALVENGLDAHTQAKTKRKVALEFSPRDVIVLDEGLGISPEDFQNHFTKFFASNRTGSNDYHGFFGVGAKAPLSVASQFNVRTVHEGVEYSWVCTRGDPAPIATLLESKPAPGNSIGTRIQIERTHMDKAFSEMHIWALRGLELKDAMPELLDVSCSVRDHRLDNRYPKMGATLVVGGMPYPCPAATILDLPMAYYEPLTVHWMVEEEVKMPNRNKKDFGKQKARATTTVETAKSLQDALRIEFAIGDIELHFSKEKVASTATNISTIRTAMEQAWLDMHWRAVEKLSQEKISRTPWRLPEDIAQKLRQQGHSVGLLAWACRPSYLSGPVESLDDLNIALPIVQRDPDLRPLTSTRWVATTTQSEHIEKVNAWAAEWGISLEWTTQPTKYDTFYRPAEHYNRNSTIPTYKQTMADLDAVNPIVVASDSEWHGLDSDSQRFVGAWVSAMAQREVYFTKLTLAQVKQAKPDAVDFKEYCRESLCAALSAIPEDALGMRTVVVHPPYRGLPPWGANMLDNKTLMLNAQAGLNHVDIMRAVHDWTGIPSPTYIALEDWVQEQTKKLPLLALSRFSANHYEHIETLLNFS